MADSPPRKRLKRTTKSCYQCRKRKVKCSLTEANVSNCAECMKSGTQCTLDAPDAGPSNRGSAAQSNGSEDHGSRLDRIESLLKRLVEAQDGGHAGVTPTSIESQPAMPAGLWDDPMLDLGGFGASPSSNGLGDIAGLDTLASTPGTFSSTTQFTGPITTPPVETTGPAQSLVTLLPSPQDAVTIVMNTFAWLWGAETPSGSVLRPDDTIQLLDLASISQGSPIQVAKTLLLFALYMQQLPDGFDDTLLGFENVDQAINVIMERVKAFVMTHEDEASSLDGLECLLLLSTIHLNTGDIKKTWVSFRRTVDMARLAGVHTSFSVSERDSTSAEDAFRRRLWLSSVSGEVYCSLLLGQQPIMADQAFGPSHERWTDPVAEKEANVQRWLCALLATVAERNAAGQYRDQEAITELWSQMLDVYEYLPKFWWDIPSFAPDRSLDSAQEPNRLICQMWYFLLKIFIILPDAFSFGRSKPESMGHMREFPLACVSILERHINLQHAKEQLSRCRGGEQAVFLAAAALLLVTAEHRDIPQHLRLHFDDSFRISECSEQCRELIQKTIDSFELRGKGGCREQVSKQCAEILSVLRDRAVSEDPFATPGPVVSSSIRKCEMANLLNSAIRPSMHEKSAARYLLDLVFH